MISLISVTPDWALWTVANVNRKFYYFRKNSELEIGMHKTTSWQHKNEGFCSTGEKSISSKIAKNVEKTLSVLMRPSSTRHRIEELTR